ATVRATLAAWLADPAREVVGHDVKQLLKMVDNAAAGAAIDSAPRPRAAIFDTMLVSYLLRPAVRGHALAEVALERLGVQVITDVEAGWGKEQEPPPGDARLLACAAERVT